MKKKLSEIQMAIRNALPDTLTYTEKYTILSKLSDEYRIRSRKEVVDEVNKFKAKTHDNKSRASIS